MYKGGGVETMLKRIEAVSGFILKRQEEAFLQTDNGMAEVGPRVFMLGPMWCQKSKRSSAVWYVPFAFALVIGQLPLPCAVSMPAIRQTNHNWLHCHAV